MAIRIRLVGRLLMFMLCFMLLFSLGSGVTAAQTDTVRFEDGYIIEQQGDLVEMTVLLNTTDQAKVKFSAAETSYSTTLDVTDGSGDGRVTLRFDTLQADDPEAAFRAATEEDTVTVVDRSIEPSTPSTLSTGRYNVIVSSASTRIAGLLWIESAMVHGSNTCAVPSDVRLTEIDCNTPSSQAGSTSSATSIAAGDTAAVQYHLSGIGSVLQSSPLDDQLIFVSDSSHGARTTHVMQFSNETAIEGRSLRITYSSGNIDLLSGSEPIENIGVDTNGNGVIDRSLKHAISGYNVNSDGELSITFDRSITLAADETLLFKYGVTNPRTGDSDSVEVTFGDQSATGEVFYGAAGQGTLGSGLDLRIEGADSDIISPIQTFDILHNSRTDTLTVVVDTKHFDRGTYDIVLTVDSASVRYPYEDTITLRERIQIVEPNVSNFSATETDGQVRISAQTNLAPRTPLFVELKSAPDDFRYLFVRQTFVRDNGSVSYVFDSPIQGNFTATLNNNDEMIAGPVQIELGNRTNSDESN